MLLSVRRLLAEDASGSHFPKIVCYTEQLCEWISPSVVAAMLRGQARSPPCEREISSTNGPWNQKTSSQKRLSSACRRSSQSSRSLMGPVFMRVHKPHPALLHLIDGSMP
jgi:hypothetical protein